MAKKEEIKKEFNKFATKIAMLQSLRKELDSLDTRGFEKEAKFIRTKLGNVNFISEARRDINKLSRKVKQKRRLNADQSKKLKDKIAKLEAIVSQKRKTLQQKSARLQSQERQKILKEIFSIQKKKSDIVKKEAVARREYANMEKNEKLKLLNDFERRKRKLDEMLKRKLKHEEAIRKKLKEKEKELDDILRIDKEKAELQKEIIEKAGKLF